ncbi:MAG: tRNA 4-thiouridine(8) synthase ThiI [Firmicutes bacterium]|nr:tRNA 4-thiouridine(8) synthase ThiI [Bacillota bacterium]
MNRQVVLRFGELALKGKNRNYFVNRLVKNIKIALRKHEDFKLSVEYGRIFVECHEYNLDDIISDLTNVFGIVGLYVGYKADELELDEIKKIADLAVKDMLSERNIKTFKVETNRPNKAFKFKSPEVSRIIGGYINQTFDELSVDVNNPDVIVKVEIRKDAYVFSREIDCRGGLPYGTSGKAMLLLSGGIDSPVAGFMMAKRGVEIEAVHYHSFPFTSERAQEKVYDLARLLTKYTGRIKVYSVNLLNIQRAVAENCPSDEMTIISRRFMMQIAEKIALDKGSQGLITGENIAQVASQTIEGLNVTNSSVTLPIFRPLLAFDKNDIIKIAKDIGTFETSILPFEDCCTVFLPDKVVTRPKVADIEESVSVLDQEALIDDAIENMETFVFNMDEL